jgi:enterochelin esterase-like enzyme
LQRKRFIRAAFCFLYQNLTANFEAMRYLIISFFLNIITIASAQQPIPSSGKIIRHSDFPSNFVKPRTIDVWLPEGYSAEKKYAVLYMHDGQMLFDSTITWNKQEWGVDEVLSQLMKKKKIQDCIVVGIWNGGTSRHSEYFPQKPLDYLSKQKKDSLYYSYRPNGQSVFQGESVQSDRYLKFLANELKPFIDQTYSTKKEREHTFIAGSSMGGLISLYAICEYPDLFGGAACISTHWPGIFSLENNPIPDAFLEYLEKNLPSPVNHKIYFDHGTATLDSLYPSIQKRVDRLMKQKGYKKRSWITRVFPGANHSEVAWRARLEIPIVFLLRKK